MIIYKDILSKLKAAGYNTTQLRREKLIPESTLQRIRSGETLSLDTIDKLCSLLNCRVEDLIEHAEDDSKRNALNQP